MKDQSYQALKDDTKVNRRDFIKTVGAGSALAYGLVLGVPAFGKDNRSPEIKTNIDDFLKIPRKQTSLPGPYPGKVVKIRDQRSMIDEKKDPKVIQEMFAKGIQKLTGKNLNDSYSLLFDKNDIVGIKVNPVGAPLINTSTELTDATINWLLDNGLPKENIIIWDRFDYMLTDAGYTQERFPGIKIEGLQTMDEEGNTWKDAEGNHVSRHNFDMDTYYYAQGIVGKNVRGYPNDEFYLNQHVFNGEYSYFGNLVTKRLTKIINLAAYKNTGNGISMATKNMGYGALCNVGRLHASLFFRVNTEVLAAPAIRDKMVLNITDGIRAQYDGGPDKNAQFVYPNHSLYFATDPFALDMVCHKEVVAKREEMGVKVNKNPRYTDYLRYGEKLGLGMVDEKKLKLITG